MSKELIYCSKKLDNWGGKCGRLAQYKVTLKNRNNGKEKFPWRCEKHQNTGTSSYKVIDKERIFQEELKKEIKNRLKAFVGRRVRSRWHRHQDLVGKYIKDYDKIMCQREKNGRWACVYYSQIKEEL